MSTQSTTTIGAVIKSPTFPAWRYLPWVLAICVLAVAPFFIYPVFLMNLNP